MVIKLMRWARKILDLNHPDTLYIAPSVDMVCCKCGYVENVPYDILIVLNFGYTSLHALACPKCSHTKLNDILYPKVIVDSDGNPITYQDVLK